MPDRSHPLARGKSTTQLANTMIGLEKDWPDVDWGSTENVKPFLSNARSKCMLVYNAHTAAVLPKQVVLWATGYSGKRTAAPAGAGVLGAGIVDEYLPAAGCAAASYYWLVRKGPTKGLNNAAALAQDSLVKTGATGKLAADAANPPVLGCCGRVMTACATTDTSVRINCNFERF